MEDIEKLLKAGRPKLCERCLGRMVYIDNGKYRCQICGHEMYDDLGKIKQCLDQYGAISAEEIAKSTGVALEIVEMCIKDGKVEMPTETFQYKCGRCGCGIRSGRFCQNCKRELAGGLKAMFDSKP